MGYQKQLGDWFGHWVWKKYHHLILMHKKLKFNLLCQSYFLLIKILKYLDRIRSSQNHLLVPPTHNLGLTHNHKNHTKLLHRKFIKIQCPRTVLIELLEKIKLGFYLCLILKKGGRVRLWMTVINTSKSFWTETKINILS